MLEAITYQDILNYIKNNRLRDDTIGILITQPDLDTGKSILKSLNYYHHLSGENMNFIYQDMARIGMEIIRMAVWLQRLMV